MHQKPANPGFTTFIRASHARPRILPLASETRKLEQETQEKMRKLAEIRSTIAVERQVTEELRIEVSSKGWSSLNPMPPSYEKSMKPLKALLQQPPPSNFKIKRNSSTFKSPDTSGLNENKFAKYGHPPPAHLKNMNHGCGPDPGLDSEEEAHCTSAVEALKQWHNSGCINPADVQQKPQQQFQSEPVPISCWEESNQHHGTCRPMEMDTKPPEEESDHTRTAMDTQTEKPKVLAEVESKPPSTIEGTYFQHLFLHQDYHRNTVRA